MWSSSCVSRSARGLSSASCCWGLDKQTGGTPASQWLGALCACCRTSARSELTGALSGDTGKLNTIMLFFCVGMSKTNSDLGGKKSPWATWNIILSFWIKHFHLKAFTFSVKPCPTSHGNMTFLQWLSSHRCADLLPSKSPASGIAWGWHLPGTERRFFCAGFFSVWLWASVNTYFCAFCRAYKLIPSIKVFLEGPYSIILKFVCSTQSTKVSLEFKAFLEGPYSVFMVK